MDHGQHSTRPDPKIECLIFQSEGHFPDAQNKIAYFPEIAGLRFPIHK
jgi:hypothetical protein